MGSKDLRLNCTRCGAFTEYYRKDGDPKSIARCDDCGKKHSDDSVFFVDVDKRYRRDEAGNLLEDVF